MGDHCNNIWFIKRYEGYQKRGAQKAKIKEELMPIAWHPARWWDWCVSEDEKDAAIALINDDLKILNMIMWHCKHNGMYIRTSYKNVKTSLPNLRHVMFLMQKIQAKTTMS